MKASKVLKQIENKAQKENLPIVGPDKAQVIIEALKKNKPKRILEVGTLIGYSAILIASNVSDDSEIVTLEIDPKNAKKAEEDIREVGFEDKIKIVIGDARYTIPTLSGKFDFVFLDATKEYYIDYLKAAEKKLEKGAVVIADNVGIFADQMREYLDYIRESGDWESRTVNLGFDALEISKKISGR